MDEMVKAALEKWPNVPDCYGWLSLDRRGQWRLGSERLTVTNPAMNAFIGRNYTSDQTGRWLFQNGPQRVFVELDYTPWIWRLVPAIGPAAYALQNQVGSLASQPAAVWLDEQGRFLFEADARIGVLHDHDALIILDLLRGKDGTAVELDQLEEALQNGKADRHDLFLHWSKALILPLGQIHSAEVGPDFGFIPSPQPED